MTGKHGCLHLLAAAAARALRINLVIYGAVVGDKKHQLSKRAVPSQLKEYHRDKTHFSSYKTSSPLSS
jgi:hypothetical protein